MCPWSEPAVPAADGSDPTVEGSTMDPAPQARSPAAVVDCVSRWRVVAAFLGSLLQMGAIYEAAGAPEDALLALKEGRNLVR